MQAVLAARIDRLAPGDKALLQTASVVGKDVPFALLRATAALAEDELRAAIGRLQAAEFLYETSLFPDLEYTFKHALTHEVAYGSLLQDRRRRLHGEIVAAIERLYPDRLGEHTERLGHHAFRAERWETAAAYLRQAGAQGRLALGVPGGRGGVRECAGGRRASSRRLGRGRSRRSTCGSTCASPLQALARIDRLLEHDRAAEISARNLGDEERLGRVSSGLANTLLIIGDHAAAIAAAWRALDIGVRLGDVATRATAILRLGAIHYTTGEYDKAVGYLRQCVELTGGERLRERFGMAGLASVLARHWLARAFAELGAFSEGLAMAREGLDINLSTDNVASSRDRLRERSDTSTSAEGTRRRRSPRSREPSR